MYSTIPSTVQAQILAWSIDQEVQSQPHLFSVIPQNHLIGLLGEILSHLQFSEIFSWGTGYQVAFLLTKVQTT